MKILPLITTALLTSASLCNAIVLVQVGGGEEITTGYAPFSGPSNDWQNPGESTISPNSGSYVAQPFYGFYGAQFTPTSTGITSDVSPVGVANQNNPDYLSTSSGSLPIEDGESSILLAPLFVLDTPAQSVESLDFQLRGFGQGGPTTLRALVQADGNYYVSDSLDTSTGVKDLTATTWFDYTPDTDAWAIGASASFDGSGDITAVGIWLTEFVDFTVGETQAAGTGFSTMTFEGTVVPEPSTYALLTGLAILGLTALRRRR